MCQELFTIKNNFCIFEKEIEKKMSIDTYNNNLFKNWRLLWRIIY